jgi:hypothetical protein
VEILVHAVSLSFRQGGGKPVQCVARRLYCQQRKSSASQLSPFPAAKGVELNAEVIADSQRQAAKVAAWAYLLPFAVVVAVNFGIHSRLITPNHAQTARNILAHETLFRIGIAGDVIYCAGIVVQLTALYMVLRPVNRGWALLAAFLRLVWALMWLAMTLRLFDALRLLHAADSTHALAAAQLQDLAAFSLDTRFDEYYVGLLFVSLASAVCGALWFRSRYLPRALAAFGIVSSAWCAGCTFTFYLFPVFDNLVNLWWFDMPMGIFDLAASFWLLARGLEPLTSAEPAQGKGQAHR